MSRLTYLPSPRGERVNILAFSTGEGGFSGMARKRRMRLYRIFLQTIIFFDIIYPLKYFFEDENGKN